MMPNMPDVLPHGAKLQAGAFVVGKILGRGGFGTTYHGADIKLRRYVAIKEFCPSNCMRNGAQLVPSDTVKHIEATAKFLEEARILAKFNHHSIVNVLTAFEENNTAYMVMEFLKGRTLQQLVEERGILTEGEGINYVERIGEALVRVHEVGLIHRDIKPDNIILCDDNRIVLIDFGLHKQIEVARSYDTRQLTATTRLGTAGYAPPEQYLQHASLGTFTDVYALGATLYFLLTGQAPVSAPERAMGEVMLSPQRLNPSLSPAINSAILHSMEVKSDERPQTIRDFLDELGAGLRPKTVSPSILTPVSVTPLPLSNTAKKRGYCAICGGSNSHDNLACGYCGARLPWATQSLSSITITPPASTPTLSVPPTPIPAVKQASGARLTHTPSYNFSGFSSNCPHCSVNNLLPHFDSPNAIFQCHNCRLYFGVPGIKVSRRSWKMSNKPIGWFDRAMIMAMILGVGVPSTFLIGMIVGIIPCFILSSIIGSDLGIFNEIVAFGCGFGAVAWFLKSCVEDRMFW